jgi:hypothetical protein
MSEKAPRCLVCAIKLSWELRADARYCSSACRSYAYRRRPSSEGQPARQRRSSSGTDRARRRPHSAEKPGRPMTGPSRDVVESLLRWQWLQHRWRAIELADSGMLARILIPQKRWMSEIEREMDDVAASLVSLSRSSRNSRSTWLPVDVRRWLTNRRKLKNGSRGSGRSGDRPHEQAAAVAFDLDDAPRQLVEGLGAAPSRCRQVRAASS